MVKRRCPGAREESCIKQKGKLSRGETEGRVGRKIKKEAEGSVNPSCLSLR